jgi:hypothetical protein
MLRSAPPDWAHALPGYGAGRVLIDAALTPAFDETGPRSPSHPWRHWPGCSPSWTPAPPTGA